MTCRLLQLERMESRRLLTATTKVRHAVEPVEVNAISDMTTADLDGDGDLDLLFADGLVGWKENLGGGTFGFRQNIGNRPDAATSVTAADIDSDGDLDVVTLHGLLNGDEKWKIRPVFPRERPVVVGVARPLVGAHPRRRRRRRSRHLLFTRVSWNGCRGTGVENGCRAACV